MIAIAIFVKLGMNNELEVVHYEYRDDRIKGKVKIAYLSDLHSCNYGEKQEGLVSVLEEESPDVVLLGGDIFDDTRAHDKGFELLEEIQGKYEIYYTTGNHEFRLEDVEDIIKKVESYDIKALRGETIPLLEEDLNIDLSGIDDIDVGYHAYHEEFKEASASRRDGSYSILLSHRPQYFDHYANKGYDLVVSGHVHGGMWRIPFIGNGLFAPGQGLFPKYLGGEYKEKNSTMVLGRGLSKKSTGFSRLYNPPEMVFITLEGDN